MFLNSLPDKSDTTCPSILQFIEVPKSHRGEMTVQTSPNTWSNSHDSKCDPHSVWEIDRWINHQTKWLTDLLGHPWVLLLVGQKMMQVALWVTTDMVSALILQYAVFTCISAMAPAFLSIAIQHQLELLRCVQTEHKANFNLVLFVQILVLECFSAHIYSPQTAS